MINSATLKSLLARSALPHRENHYFVSTFEKSITVYKQQLRALNLIFAFYNQKTELHGKSIAVIGGGITGLTVTKAALTLGYKVFLFESKHVLCHLQAGCDIRWIHPRIYNWPDVDSETIYARLPILSWQANTASEVTRQILTQFRKDLPKSKYFEHTGVKWEFPLDVSGKTQYNSIAWSDMRGQSRIDNLAAVIYSVGFGIEKDIDGMPYDIEGEPYWRNDHINQHPTGITSITNYIISGTGDGGFIDLLRVKIENFNQGRLVQELFEGQASLISKLRTIKEQWPQRSPEDDLWLYHQYLRLEEENDLDALKSSLELRLRRDTNAVFHGTLPRFEYSLRLDRVSLLNTLLVYILHSTNRFEYKSGNLVLGKGKKIPCINSQKFPGYKVIVRHGPDQTLALRSIGCSDDDINHFRESCADPTVDQVLALWPAGWWSEHSKNKIRSEFVAPLTSVIADTFISSLTQVIRYAAKEGTGKSFDCLTCLFRVIEVNETQFVQQIVNFNGNRQQNKNPLGKIWSIDEATNLVSLTCQIGKPLLANKSQIDNLIKHKIFSSAEPYETKSLVQSYLTVPFFAPAKFGTGYKVSLILYIDSKVQSFFSEAILELVYAACTGFVLNLENLYTKGDIQFIPSPYVGYKPSLDELASFSTDIVPDEQVVFPEFAPNLQFEKISSFDVELQTEGKLNSYSKQSEADLQTVAKAFAALVDKTQLVLADESQFHEANLSSLEEENKLLRQQLAMYKDK